jgi:hypothetical protein
MCKPQNTPKVCAIGVGGTTTKPNSLRLAGVASPHKYTRQ